ncbi:hypothetical protein, partial [Paraliobacillus sp. JSM ZJ581]|uniref:hypothetical protein n=1 Tax=Paraliobacillus sp. JSM ZJ581 TaxID=3342118 RepID=UPI0035A9987E
MVRSVDGVSEVFQNPQTQINEQVIHLKKFLHEYRFPQVPIHTIVCFTHPKVNLNIGLSRNNMITSEQLPSLIRELSHYPTKNKLNTMKLGELAHFLDRHHTDYRLHFRQKYHLSNGHIRNGVWCTGCKKSMMNREKRTWIFPMCGTKDKLAHKQALIDYALIYKETIRNEEARRFLCVQSDSIVKRLLAGLNLNARGENKAREYCLSTLREDCAPIFLRVRRYFCVCADIFACAPIF